MMTKVKKGLEEVQVHYKRSGNVCACVLKMAAEKRVCASSSSSSSRSVEGLDFLIRRTTRCILSSSPRPPSESSTFVKTSLSFLSQLFLSQLQESADQGSPVCTRLYTARFASTPHKRQGSQESLAQLFSILFFKFFCRFSPISLYDRVCQSCFLHGRERRTVLLNQDTALVQFWKASAGACAECTVHDFLKRFDTIFCEYVTAFQEAWRGSDSPSPCRNRARRDASCRNGICKAAWFLGRCIGCGPVV